MFGNRETVLPGDLFLPLFNDLIVPNLHFHTPVELPPFLGIIISLWLAVAKPFVGDGFRGKIKRMLVIFGDGARPFT